ncbi:J domain-containing protein [Montanilutibacter psychrotolerans]|uniref:J domain-containing protein n=1 Tax=Montanilutibacter psychrotolerans TaxID=1327343 RepID=A0A3M8SUC5_9GAMM|nr:DnaJ domain-containing protein [Lysobacter psychrotolerans]RNF84393.1 J domain-containing protein [Lysobacter psychrotolerans]
MKRWYGKLLGFFAGAALLRGNPLLGAALGLLIGHAFDSDWFKLARDNPYSVLGLTSDANDAEVDQAYRRLISQYHPDRLAGAARELREQAETRAREINGAYDRIKALRKR